MALREGVQRLSRYNRGSLRNVWNNTTWGASSYSSHSTSFGYQQVSEKEKSKLVGDVFKSVASSYDVMNDLMSVGLHRLWKDRLVSKLRPFPGMQHLDVAGGTGDVAFRVLDAIRRVEQRSLHKVTEDAEAEDETRVYVCDINPTMLEVGKQHAREREEAPRGTGAVSKKLWSWLLNSRVPCPGLAEVPSLVWVEGDAEKLEFKDESMDGYTIAFGIRNVTHIDKALKEAHRVLKRGGRFLCLELSQVDIPVFKQIYHMYSFSVIPAVGELVAGDRKSYQYLVESVRRFPSQQKFAEMIAHAGFQDVQYENLVGGVVAIHSAFKL